MRSLVAPPLSGLGVSESDYMGKREWEKWWECGTKPDFPRRYVKRWKGELILWSNSPVRRIIQKEGVEVDSVLDVGCASCIDYEYFKGTGVRYAGVDITEKYVEYAKETYPEIDVRTGNVVKGVPFGDNAFDMVYLKSVVEHLHPDEWKTAVSEIWRIAKKKILLVFFIPPRNEEPEYIYKEDGFWNNRLDKRELVLYIKNLEGYDGYKLYEDITGNDIYVVYKRDLTK